MPLVIKDTVFVKKGICMEIVTFGTTKNAIKESLLLALKQISEDPDEVPMDGTIVTPENTAELDYAFHEFDVTQGPDNTIEDYLADGESH